MTEKFLVFDVSAQYGHFKNLIQQHLPYIFNSLRTAMAGMISAILGLSKTEYSKYFTRDKARIAVGIINPIKKVRIAENLISTQKSMHKIHERTQIKIEFLKDVCYRIYFTHSDGEIYGKLKRLLAGHETIYSISMGLSENLANYVFRGEFEGQIIDKNGEFVELSSIMPTDILKKGDVEYEDGKEYFTETIPIEMDVDRNVKEYKEVLFERNCKKIKARAGSYIKIRGMDCNIVITK